MKPGKLLLLDGGSSAGKASLAIAFQSILDEPYLVLGIDLFWLQPAAFSKLRSKLAARLQ